MKPLLPSLTKVSVSRGGKVLLADVTVNVLPGTITGLAGPNGAGKSTLLRLLSGLDTPSSTVDQKYLNQFPPGSRRKIVGYLGSDLQTDFPLTARECIEASFGGKWKDEGTSRLLGIAHFLDREIGTLSSGERQRIGFARLLYQDPGCFCLDESFSQQDPERLAAIREILLRKREEGTSVVLVSHDWNFLSSVCDHWIFLKKGRIVAEGKSASVLTDAGLKLLYPDAKPHFWDDPITGSRRVQFI